MKNFLIYAVFLLAFLPSNKQKKLPRAIQDTQIIFGIEWLDCDMIRNPNEQTEEEYWDELNDEATDLLPDLLDYREGRLLQMQWDRDHHRENTIENWVNQPGDRAVRQMIPICQVLISDANQEEKVKIISEYIGDCEMALDEFSKRKNFQQTGRYK